jgi:hypothetical protein
MNTIWESVTWNIARAGGFTSYIMLALSVIVGLALSTQLQSPRRWPRLINSELHNFLTLLGTIFLGVHILAVWLDPFTHFGWNELLIPLASHYRPVWMALGIVGLYGIGTGSDTLTPWGLGIYLVSTALVGALFIRRIVVVKRKPKHAPAKPAVPARAVGAAPQGYTRIANGTNGVAMRPAQQNPQRREDVARVR